MSQLKPQETDSLYTDDQYRVLQSTGGLRSDNEWYIRDALIPRRVALYNRSLSGYAEAINLGIEAKQSQFDIHDWKDKTVLDLGSGAYEAFGLEARALGVDVISLNPALVSAGHRQVLLHDNRARIEAPRKKASRSLFKAAQESVPEIRAGDLTVAAVGEALPFRDESFDCVVSVFGVPQYLYDSDMNIYEDSEKLKHYNDERRASSVERIQAAMAEIVRTLKPGGKAYLTDMHRSPEQTTNIAAYSAADGSELTDVLSAMSGVEYDVFETDDIDEESGELKAVVRTTVITRTE